MCGIYGMVSLVGEPLQFPDLATKMAETLTHRGPDGWGEVRDEDVVIGARRLRIIDRRAEADQPYTSSSGITLVCNGEIYNSTEIRRRFPQYHSRTLTDVEPLVPLLERSGVEGFSEVRGMFAAGVWDAKTRTLTLARDYAGEKPLFYSRYGDEIWFASEVQALLVNPSTRQAIHPEAVLDYLTFGFVREPLTLFQGIAKVPAGYTLSFTSTGCVDRRIDFSAHHVKPVGEKPLVSILRTSVREQMTADVPVGIFLSGGIDSSVVTVLATQSRSDIHTFTVRFKEQSYDEGLAAREIAAACGSYHHEVYATRPGLVGALRTLTTKVAEPISDPAILPTMMLAQLAKSYVGVVLSGEGADELFGGYPTYLGHRWAPLAAAIPGPLRQLAIRGLEQQAASPRKVGAAYLADRFLRHSGEATAHRHLAWFGTGLFQHLDNKCQTSIIDSLGPVDDRLKWPMEVDFGTYLRDGLLTKLDRATMLYGLEARAPFLDPRVIGYARALDLDRKVGWRRTKIDLTDQAASLLPPKIARRRKRGLSVPIAQWLREEMRGTLERTLSSDRIAKQGFLPDLPITRLVREHMESRANHARSLWPLVILQLWLDQWEGIVA